MIHSSFKQNGISYITLDDNGLVSVSEDLKSIQIINSTTLSNILRNNMEKKSPDELATFINEVNLQYNRLEISFKKMTDLSKFSSEGRYFYGDLIRLSNGEILFADNLGVSVYQTIKDFNNNQNAKKILSHSDFLSEYQSKLSNRALTEMKKYSIVQSTGNNNLNPFFITPETINFTDLATSLSGINRFAGQTAKLYGTNNEFYTVGQHCIAGHNYILNHPSQDEYDKLSDADKKNFPLIDELGIISNDEKVKLAQSFATHEFFEAITGIDMIKPFKEADREGTYPVAERRGEEIFEIITGEPIMTPLLKKVDNLMAKIEGKHLVGWEKEDTPVSKDVLFMVEGNQRDVQNTVKKQLLDIWEEAGIIEKVESFVEARARYADSSISLHKSLASANSEPKLTNDEILSLIPELNDMYLRKNNLEIVGATLGEPKIWDFVKEKDLISFDSFEELSTYVKSGAYEELLEDKTPEIHQEEQPNRGIDDLAIVNDDKLEQRVELRDKIFTIGDLDVFLKDYLINQDTKDTLNYLCEDYLDYEDYHGEPFDVIYERLEESIYGKSEMQKVTTNIINDLEDDELNYWNKEYNITIKRFGAGFMGGVDTIMWDRTVEENGDYKRVGTIDKGVCELESDYLNDSEAIKFAKSMGATEFKNLSTHTQIQTLFLELSEIKVHEEYNSQLNQIVGFAEKENLVNDYRHEIEESEKILSKLRRQYVAHSIDDALYSHDNDLEKLNSIHEKLSDEYANWGDSRFYEQQENRLLEKIISLETMGKKYYYGLSYRPAGIGTAPKGYTMESDYESSFRHGVISYDRRLTGQELDSFELVDLSDEQLRERANTALNTMSKYAKKYLDNQKAFDSKMFDYGLAGKFSTKINPSKHSELKDIVLTNLKIDHFLQKEDIYLFDVDSDVLHYKDDGDYNLFINTSNNNIESEIRDRKKVERIEKEVSSLLGQSANKNEESIEELFTIDEINDDGTYFITLKYTHNYENGDIYQEFEDKASKERVLSLMCEINPELFMEHLTKEDRTRILDSLANKYNNLQKTVDSTEIIGYDKEAQSKYIDVNYKDDSYYIYSDGSVLKDAKNGFISADKELTNIVKKHADEKLLKELLKGNKRKLTYAEGDLFFPKGTPTGESLAIYKTSLSNHKMFIDKLNSKKLPINESTIKQLNLNLSVLKKLEEKYNIERGEYKNENEFRNNVSLSPKNDGRNKDNTPATDNHSKRDDGILSNSNDSMRQQRETSKGYNPNSNDESNRRDEDSAKEHFSRDSSEPRDNIRHNSTAEEGYENTDEQSRVEASQNSIKELPSTKEQSSTRDNIIGNGAERTQENTTGQSRIKDELLSIECLNSDNTYFITTLFTHKNGETDKRIETNASKIRVSALIGADDPRDFMQHLGEKQREKISGIFEQEMQNINEEVALAP